MKFTMRDLRTVIVFLMIADILVFSRASVLTFLALGVGAAMIFMGILFGYRPSSAFGSIVVAVGAASSIEITDLTEVSKLLTAAIGLLIPIFILVLVATSIERGPIESSVLMRRPAVLSSLYLLICLFSVPVTLFLLSLFAPEFSARSSAMAETAILLLAAIAGAVVASNRNPEAAIEIQQE